MTMRIDILTNDAGELVRREHARELGAGVIVSIYRLVKLSQLHDLSNQAFLRQLDQTYQVIGDYCLRAGTNVSALFAHKAVFIAGQLLKGSRSAYEGAAELGEILERLGGSDLYIQRDVSREELLAFAEQVSISARSAPGAFRSPTPKIRLRKVNEAARLRGIELEDLTTDQRIVRTYASAIVVMRRFFEDLQASRYILPRRIKRVAQSLVDLSDGSTPAFLGVTEVRNANFDEAGRAANTAILAVAMAREVTSDRSVLSQIAMAAMMHDVARPRALALAAAAFGGAAPKMAGPTMLSEDQEDRLPAGAVAVLTALSRVNEPSIRRSVLTYEALWLRRQTWLGPVYWGARPPTMHAKLLAVARRYNDLLTPEPGLPPPTTDFAVATLSEELKDPQDRTVLRLLVSALGLLPVGTVVQLSTGELAEVVRGTRGPLDLPRVRVVMGETGAVLSQQVEIELAQDPRRTVSRVISVDGWKKGLEQASASASPAPASEPPPPVQAARARPSPSNSAELGADAREPSGAREASGARQVGGALAALGSSPSAVADAMGRVLRESASPVAAARESSTPVEPKPEPRVAVPEPTARGSLAATPLPHVLVYMLDHGLTGSVVFEHPDAQVDTIHFVSGVPVKVRLRDEVALLGRILVHARALDPRQLDALVDEAKRAGTLLGAHLIDRGMLSEETLAWALEAQVLHRISHLANLPGELSYAYYQDVDVLAGWGKTEPVLGSPLSAVLTSVRSWTDRERVSATLNRIGKHRLVIHDDADLAHVALTPTEKAALDAIRNDASTFPDLLGRQLGDPAAVSSLVYALAVTRQFALKGQRKGPMAGRGTPSLRAKRPSEAAPERREPRVAASSAPAARRVPAKPAVSSPAGATHSLARSSERAASEGPLAPNPARPSALPAAGGGSAQPRSMAPAVLPGAHAKPQIRPIAKRGTIRGVGPSSPPGEGPLVARTHPITAPPPSMPPPADDDGQTIAYAPPGLVATGDELEVVEESEQAGATEPPMAPGLRSSAPISVRRSAPPLPLPSQARGPAPGMGPGMHRIASAGLAEAEAALEAMTSFRLAESALQRNDMAAALRLAAKAAEGDPSQPDHVALLAWLRALDGGEAAVAAAIDTMNQVLTEDPSNERARFYRGKLYARAGRVPEAIADFGEILAANPRHAEVTAELRTLRAHVRS